MMSNKNYCIKEYDYFASSKYAQSVPKGNYILPQKTFEMLEDFILKNSDVDSRQVDQFMTISYKASVGKIIKAQNYVGVLQMADGTTIEILPKIYECTDENSYLRVKKIFLKMLRSCLDLPIKSFDLASLGAEKMNIMDIFIQMFLTELAVLVKEGLKSAYLHNEENNSFFKGKLLTNEHIKTNYADRTKFYTSFEEFSINRPENRLIKTTLDCLRNKTRNRKLQLAMKQLNSSFVEVECSKDYNADFSKCHGGRLLSHYDTVLKWCRVFLEAESFNNFKGEHAVFSLLFPMEKVFEMYIAKVIRNSHLAERYSVFTQHSKHYLLSSDKLYRLKPDIVLQAEDNYVILDTKWKLLSAGTRDFGISQSDLYQMYAYLHKYKSRKVILIYPLFDNEIQTQKFTYEEGKDLFVYFVDIEKLTTNNILAELSGELAL